MSDYDEFFNSIDDDDLAQVDALEAVESVRGVAPTRQNMPRAKQYPKSASNASSAQQNDSESAFFDLTLDGDDLDELEQAATRQMNAQAGPSRFGGAQRTGSEMRQKNLLGDIVPDPSPPKQVQRRPAFGQKLQKTKVWDQTAFAKTGWRSTKPPKGKGKGKATANADEDEECVDLDSIPTPFMPLEPVSLFAISEAGPQSVQITKMKLKPDALSVKEWLFPLNNPKRDYQFNIVLHSLFENCLVAIPTGVGKTFIAGCVMLNYYRWFPEGKIIFVAPTKPLVAQQIEACHQSCGIPGTDAIELTGQIPRVERAVHWQTKRVFYMTPQTLVNDLATKTCDPETIALLVIDEAHKGTGDYAYAQIVRFMMATNPFFRILALTATPGSKPEAVQAIVDSLHISHIEIRNESSMDVQPYMHKKTTNQHIIDTEGDLLKIRELLVRLIDAYLTPLRNQGILHYSSALAVKEFMCMSKMRELDSTQKWAYGSLRTLGALARALGYFMEFSVGMAYNSLQDLGKGPKKDAKKPAKPSEAKILKDVNYVAVIKEIERQKNDKGAFPVHPKMEKLRSLAVQHFANADLDEEAKVKPGDRPAASTTKMIVFCTYRECVDEIVEMFQEQQPMIRAHKFIGQGADKRGGKGVSQKAQIEVIKDFKLGKYNVLVSTSIGEEGLDIGEVDIIVCYDAQKAAIRMVQRVGRTGRKKDGKVEVLLCRGREENNWASALASYKDVQQSIVRGTDLELYGDVEQLLLEKPQKCIEMRMEIIPYEREERKRSTSGPKSRQANIKTALLKTKTSAKRQRALDDENEEVEESPAKKQRRFVESDSDSDLVAPKAKRTNGKSKGNIKPMANLKPMTLPKSLTGFTSARDLAKHLALDDDDNLDPEAVLRQSPVRNKLKPTAKAEVPKRNKHARGAAKPETQPKASMGWLLDSDEERESHSPQVEIIDLGDSDEAPARANQKPRLTRTESLSSPALASTPAQNGLKTRLPSSPEVSFSVGMPRQRSRPAAVIHTQDDSFEISPVLQRIKRKGDVDTRSMPPPPLPSGVGVQSSERPGAGRVKRSILERNEFLEIEATHSGDEVEAGSSDSEGIANSDDLNFVVDTSATQAPSDYDQSAVYRQGLFTQGPAGGPRFNAGPIRKGYLGAGVLGRPSAYGAPSSSPVRGDQASDGYSMGSFVVEDDDDIVFGGSSQ